MATYATTYAGSLPRYTANTALLQLTETKDVRCLPEKTKSLSLKSGCSITAHIGLLYLFTQIYIISLTKNIISPTMHPKFLIPYIKPQ
jgi:hypothetical protein